MVQRVWPPELANPVEWLRAQGPLGWEGMDDRGVRGALDLYEDRKDGVLQDLLGRIKAVDRLTTEFVSSPFPLFFFFGGGKKLIGGWIGRYEG